MRGLKLSQKIDEAVATVGDVNVYVEHEGMLYALNKTPFIRAYKSAGDLSGSIIISIGEPMGFWKPEDAVIAPTEISHS